jgi:hypothetical protein
MVPVSALKFPPVSTTMKTLRFLCLLGVACLWSNGCSAQKKEDVAPMPAPNPPAVTADAIAAEAATTAAAVTASDSWDLVKDYTYDQRGAFAAALNHMTDRLDAGIVRLNSQRATLPQTSTKDWDFAMKEVSDARSDLRFQVGELDKATPETWNDVKDKLAQAWQRTKDAFDKVRTSTTT